MSDSAAGARQRSDLGPYLLGALDARRNEPFERHLAVCDECRWEAGTLAGVVVALVLLSAEECRLILREFCANGCPPAKDIPSG